MGIEKIFPIGVMNPRIASVTKPNFLLLGAQKCGTTALYHALKQHPQIFLSQPKEPFFFAMDGKPPPYNAPEFYHRFVRYTLKSYLTLFEKVEDETAVGEASAIYLSSYHPDRIAARIYDFNPEMKLIGLIRHPADRAWSAYHYYLSKGMEHAKSFEEALEAERLRGQILDLPDIRHFANGCYHANLKPYFDRFPADQIRIILYDDLLQRPQDVLLELFTFLNVNPEEEIKIERQNVTYIERYNWLGRLLREDQSSAYWRLIPVSRARQRIIRMLSEYNRAKMPVMPKETRVSLIKRYRSDIEQLQTLLNKDMSQWFNA